MSNDQRHPASQSAASVEENHRTDTVKATSSAPGTEFFYSWVVMLPADVGRRVQPNKVVFASCAEAERNGWSPDTLAMWVSGPGLLAAASPAAVVVHRLKEAASRPAPAPARSPGPAVRSTGPCSSCGTFTRMKKMIGGPLACAACIGGHHLSDRS